MIFTLRVGEIFYVNFDIIFDYDFHLILLRVMIYLFVYKILFLSHHLMVLRRSLSHLFSHVLDYSFKVR